MISKTELKALIPYGKYKEVAEKAGVSSGAVTKFFNDQIKSSFKIQKAAMEIAIECKTDLQKLQLELTN